MEGLSWADFVKEPSLYDELKAKYMPEWTADPRRHDAYGRPSPSISRAQERSSTPGDTLRGGGVRAGGSLTQMGAGLLDRTLEKAPANMLARPVDAAAVSLGGAAAGTALWPYLRLPLAVARASVAETARDAASAAKWVGTRALDAARGAAKEAVKGGWRELPKNVARMIAEKRAPIAAGSGVWKGVKTYLNSGDARRAVIDGMRDMSIPYSFLGGGAVPSFLLSFVPYAIEKQEGGGQIDLSKPRERAEFVDSVAAPAGAAMSGMASPFAPPVLSSLNEAYKAYKAYKARRRLKNGAGSVAGAPAGPSGG